MKNHYLHVLLFLVILISNGNCTSARNFWSRRFHRPESVVIVSRSYPNSKRAIEAVFELPRPSCPEGTKVDYLNQCRPVAATLTSATVCRGRKRRCRRMFCTINGQRIPCSSQPWWRSTNHCTWSVFRQRDEFLTQEIRSFFIYLVTK